MEIVMAANYAIANDPKQIQLEQKLQQKVKYFVYSNDGRGDFLLE